MSYLVVEALKSADLLLNYSINADKSGRMNLLGDAPKPSKNMYLDAYGSPRLS